MYFYTWNPFFYYQVRWGRIFSGNLAGRGKKRRQKNTKKKSLEDNKGQAEKDLGAKLKKRGPKKTL